VGGRIVLTSQLPEPGGLTMTVPARQPRTGLLVALLVVLGLVLVGGVIAAAFVLRGSHRPEPTPSPPSVGSQEPSQPAVPPPTKQPTPQPPTVPSVVGMQSEEARSTLEEAGFKLGAVTYQAGSEEQKGIVLSQSPAADSQAAEGAAVAVTCGGGSGQIQIPADLVDKPVDEVEKRLTELGLHGRRKYYPRPREQYAEGTVFGLEPSAGSYVEPGATITLMVSQLPPAPAPSETRIVGTWSSDSVGSRWEFKADGEARHQDLRTGRWDGPWKWKLGEEGVLTLETSGYSSRFQVTFGDNDSMVWKRLGGRGESLPFRRD